MAAGEKRTENRMGCNVRSGKKLQAAQMWLTSTQLGMP
jgi:hypothetical protein